MTEWVSYRGMHWALLQWQRPDLKGADKLVLVALASHIGDERYTCWPGIARLVALVGESESTVHRSLQHLAALELISIIPRAGSTNLYRLHVAQKGCQSDTGGGVNLTPQGCQFDTQKKRKEEVPDLLTTFGDQDLDHSHTSAATNVSASRRPASASPGFEDFWRAWPRKVARRAAERAWRRLRPDAALTARILEAVRVQAARVWAGKDLEFIPHAATWLHQARWEDEVPAGRAAEAPRSVVPSVAETKARIRRLQEG